MESIIKDNETISLKKIIINYVRQWKLFVLAACISLLLAILYLVFYPKTYEVMSRLQIQEDKELGGGSIGLGEAAGLMKSFGLGAGTGTAIIIDDEIVTLSSNWLLKEMILKLGINVSYQKPFSLVKMYDESPLLVTPDSQTQESLDEVVSFVAKVQKDGSLEIKMDNTGETFSFASFPAQLKVEQGVFNITCREAAINEPFTLNISVAPAGWVAEDLADAFTIEEYSKSSNTIEILCTDHNKKRGMDMLNVLMDGYNKRASNIKKKEGMSSMIFLNGRIADVMQDLNNIELKIESYKIKNKMTDIEHDVQFYVDAVKDLRQKIIELETQQHIIVLLDSYVKDPKNKYNLIPAMLSAVDGEKGGAITVYNEALIERDRMMKSTKTDNPLLEVATNQVDKLRESVFLAIDNAKKSVGFVLTDLKKQEQAIFDKMENVPSFEREYLDLRRQQEIFQGVYLILLQKKEEIALSLGQEKDKGYVLDSAFVKKKPIAPRKLYAGLFMIVFTLFIPVFYLFVKEQIISLVKEYKKTK